MCRILGIPLVRLVAEKSKVILLIPDASTVIDAGLERPDCKGTTA